MRGTHCSRRSLRTRIERTRAIPGRKLLRSQFQVSSQLTAAQTRSSANEHNATTNPMPPPLRNKRSRATAPTSPAARKKTTPAAARHPHDRTSGKARAQRRRGAAGRRAVGRVRRRRFCVLGVPLGLRGAACGGALRVVGRERDGLGPRLGPRHAGRLVRGVLFISSPRHRRVCSMASARWRAGDAMSARLTG